MNGNAKQIVEIEAGKPVPALDGPVPVLVHGDEDVAATCARLHAGDVSCSRIAFVTNAARRSRRRLVAGLGLSQKYGCPCRIFADEDAARRWLSDVS